MALREQDKGQGWLRSVRSRCDVYGNSAHLCYRGLNLRWLFSSVLIYAGTDCTYVLDDVRAHKSRASV